MHRSVSSAARTIVLHAMRRKFESSTDHQSMRKKNPPKNCLSCWNEVPQRWRRKFCDNKCQMEFQRVNKTFPKIELGLIKRPESLKEYLYRKRGRFCELCRNDGTHNGKPLTLQLDHIDGNSDNNFPANIRALCPNCHSQTETWCKRNAKNTARNGYLSRYKRAVRSNSHSEVV